MSQVKRKDRHGHSRVGQKTLTYSSWQHMRGRCKNKNDTKYRYYGGRGITICKRWDRFQNFLADMGECPPGLTLDRIDSNGNYKPSNCRWATRQQQVANTRRCKYLEMGGIKLTIEEWSRKTGLGPNTIRYRKFVKGLPDVMCLKLPASPGPHTFSNALAKYWGGRA